MLKINQVDHINLNVKNLKKSVEFYEKFFGMKVYEEGYSSNHNPYQIIGIPGKLFLCLYQNSDFSSAGPLNHIGIHLADFENAHEKLKESGLPLLYGGLVEYPQSKSLYIADPDGNEIELSSHFGGDLA